MITDSIGNAFKNKPTWIGAVLLALFSILSQYSLPIMSYGLILASVYGVVFFVLKGKMVLNRSILLFTMWCLISQLIIYSISGTFLKNQNTYLFMFVAMFLLATIGLVEADSFFKVYYLLGAIFTGVVFFQFVMGNILGIPQSAIRILPVASEDLHFWIQNTKRASGFFSEPQAYSSYIIPLLIQLLFKRRIKGAILISLGIVSSTSSQGIIIAMMIWIYYLVLCEKDMAKVIIRCVVSALLLAVAVLMMLRTPALQPIIEKILSINLGGYDIRLTKGFQIYAAMPVWDKFTGIGFGNLREYLLNGNFHFFWIALTRDELLAYITTMSNVLVSFGIVAFALYINIFKENWKSGTPEAKLMLIVILVSSFTQTILFNAWYVFYWTIYEVFDSYDNKRYLFVSLRSAENA